MNVLSGSHALQGLGGLLALDHDGAAFDQARADDYSVGLVGWVIWPDQKLQARARAEGEARAFLEAVRQYGAQVFRHMEGAFAAFFHDHRENSTSIAIDHAGQYRLFWMPYRGGFVFSSRLSVLSSLPDFAANLRPESLHDYLFFYTTLSPNSLYAGVEKLLPGHAIRFHQGRAEPQPFWQMPYATSLADPSPRGLSDLAQKLYDGLDGAVERSLESARSPDVGSFLSGGLDSSTITGLAAAHHPGFKSFTIRFDDPRYDEGPYARLAAQRFHTDHHERLIEPHEVVGVMDQIAAYTDEPYGNTSAIAAYYCAIAARDAGVKVLLAGDGGDEIFAGNERYIDVRRYDVYGKIPEPLRRFLLDPLLASNRLDPLPFLGKAHRLMKRYHLSLPRRMFADYHPFQNFSAGDVAGPALYDHFSRANPLKSAESIYEAGQSGDPVQRMMALDLHLTIADNDLVKVNSMCALAGIDVRYPMLDRPLMELAASIPMDVLLADGRLRGFFKRSFAALLPTEIIEKKKHGFGLPFQVWVLDHPDLAHKLLDTLEDLRQRGLFTDLYIDALQHAVRGGGARNLLGNAWDATMLELWMKSHPTSF
ncbi:asparagine synthetase B [Iodidimonas nitroreducens]|uniref:asparagine synthase (glutamine-hydrolyzing) n=1 Tax=Iodidimonas nitroreducens TaxID=1236968 RepID=A0A5A7N925_9PROT|nr:asparagine synthase C-terminal domain-containing protein [Iodidimonas nitroreducens]GAK32247.1 putative asparagine synthetase [alpha proteobacterium Q-1]GER04852.1 asparagine synthetase B [Iodidimonas nitroreducens]